MHMRKGKVVVLGLERFTWRRVLGPSRQAFVEAHLPRHFHHSSRQSAIAIAYLLRCFTDVTSLDDLQWILLANRIFGRASVSASMGRLIDLSGGWGYRTTRAFQGFVAEAFLVAQGTELTSLSAERIAGLANRQRNLRSRHGFAFRLRRLLKCSFLDPTYRP